MSGIDVPFGDMPPEEFGRHAAEVVEWIEGYLRDVGEYPTLSPARPGDLSAQLPAEGPDQGEGFDAILADFRDQVLPGITHWNHPAFHGYFANSASGPGILGEMLTAALNVNAMVWRSSPAATELEERTLDWLRQWLGLPDAFPGTINDTASHSTLYALAAARASAMPRVAEEGLAGGPQGCIYTSAESHSSVDKAALTLGLGRRGIRRIPVDDQFRMRPDALREAIQTDLEAGRCPIAIVATLGTTSTTAIDPVAEIAQIAREFGVWLHVDAAYGGPLALIADYADQFSGWEHADSIVVNPHKWLFTPMDCSILYCRRPDQLRAAFSLVPEYLKTGEGDGVTNLMDYGVALGRRFRSLKLWFVLRYFGRDGIRARLEHHVALAREWQSWVEAEPEWEMAAPNVMATPIYRFAPAGVALADANALNLAIMEAVNRSGVAFLSHTAVDGRIALRTSIGNIRTQREHLERTWQQLREQAALLR